MTYARVASADELAPGDVSLVRLPAADGTVRAIALARDDDGTFHALDDTCSHGQVSLSDGEIFDGALECWKHGSAFDLRTGRPTTLPATVPVTVYALAIEDGDVLVDPDTSVNAA